MHRPQVVAKAAYEKELARLQTELVRMQEWIVHEGLRVMVIFEGRDTAGKGGTIKRIMERLNARYCRVVALGTPTDRERSQWYFQRYIAHLPAAGEIVLFDRSWYNRAGVERVMGFCTEEEHAEFFRTCPQLERALVRSGIILVKYWLSLSDEEQERRFTERINNPGKRWKLSPMDLEARARWVDYAEAKDEMFSYTDIKEAPWYVVDADDKKAARLNIISHLLERGPLRGRAPRAGRAARPPAAGLRAPADRQPDMGPARATSCDDRRRRPSGRRGRRYACASSSSWASRAAARAPRPSCWPRTSTSSTSASATSSAGTSSTTPSSGPRSSGSWPAGTWSDDDLVESVVRERLAEHDWNFGFIIDGFPRNARQAEFFLESYDIDGVINLHLPDEEVHAPGAGPPAVLPVRTGLQPHRPPAPAAGHLRRLRRHLVARADDNPEALAVRLADYHEETRPLIEIFERKEFVATIDATRPVDEVQAAIRSRLRLPSLPLTRSRTR